jgi:2-polyprenyl-3-methyl-5-hydroxy-6-metoxy-1,4-benzoquinol methylase
MNKLASVYDQKPTHYFAGARKLFVDELPENRDGRLLEIGCGNGDTAAYALACGKCGWCAGVELCPDPAREAAKKLNEVIVGDIEEIELPYGAEYFDVVIMSEVLEHLRDPWAILRKVHRMVKPDGLVLAGSPNVGHYSVVSSLLRGRWDYESVGIMDRTHLRWFTPATYREMFEECGFRVDHVGSGKPLQMKARWLNRITFKRLSHLFHTQIYLKARRR